MRSVAVNGGVAWRQSVSQVRRVLSSVDGVRRRWSLYLSDGFRRFSGDPFLGPAVLVSVRRVSRCSMVWNSVSRGQAWSTGPGLVKPGQRWSCIGSGQRMFGIREMGRLSVTRLDPVNTLINSVKPGQLSESTRLTRLTRSTQSTHLAFRHKNFGNGLKT
ncbi:hypothetical protein Hanom_Chr00s101684g01804161 [Helianthus anomalus]